MQIIIGDAAAIKQDPFHVNQSFTEKISDPAKHKWFLCELSAATIFNIQRNIRPPNEMEKKISAILSAVPLSSVNVKDKEWKAVLPVI
ncbi:hypothetical protein JG687_00011592 [Phytophthora cactorum]|nr:hypothetical protein PC113_g22699 [Phytophthora cactorum]KAG2874169.1 hypothetical protein PC114_g25427 [Phytophthora cactorum]KAG2879951.1 hypothetical protein PC115_g22657 [Phytophthora cactorum]KAG2887299.1 hypothetical protein PC117_g25193 [Phytophthora cactorum]KAG2965182.1 hypothetical protein PC119_g25051 [Phytophthora cactorum]